MPFFSLFSLSYEKCMGTELNGDKLVKLAGNTIIHILSIPDEKMIRILTKRK